ncbi:hypothetical protein M0812_03627 [Anaeramoeba flamelloides]|uniref:Tetratricopeptide repeat protein n=1 Tax=Anaeramoeba flamelloides TaxID=1746091 RepID=A0AAV8AI57_9EUKA|nr:hypothetical protein M0812_03627 [Anaeramoeba flamelloides]
MFCYSFFLINFTILDEQKKKKKKKKEKQKQKTPKKKTKAEKEDPYRRSKRKKKKKKEESESEEDYSEEESNSAEAIDEESNSESDEESKSEEEKQIKKKKRKEKKRKKKKKRKDQVESSEEESKSAETMDEESNSESNGDSESEEEKQIKKKKRKEKKIKKKKNKRKDQADSSEEESNSAEAIDEESNSESDGDSESKEDKTKKRKKKKKEGESEESKSDEEDSSKEESNSAEAIDEESNSESDGDSESSSEEDKRKKKKKDKLKKKKKKRKTKKKKKKKKDANNESEEKKRKKKKKKKDKESNSDEEDEESSSEEDIRKKKKRKRKEKKKKKKDKESNSDEEEEESSNEEENDKKKEKEIQKTTRNNTTLASKLKTKKTKQQKNIELVVYTPKNLKKNHLHKFRSDECVEGSKSSQLQSYLNEVFELPNKETIWKNFFNLDQDYLKSSEASKAFTNFLLLKKKISFELFEKLSIFFDKFNLNQLTKMCFKQLIKNYQDNPKGYLLYGIWVINNKEKEKEEKNSTEKDEKKERKDKKEEEEEEEIEKQKEKEKEKEKQKQKQKEMEIEKQEEEEEEDNKNNSEEKDSDEGKENEEQKAIKIFKKGLNKCRSRNTSKSSKKDYAQLYFQLGNFAIKKGKSDEAINCYKKTLKYNPNHICAHNNLASILCSSFSTKKNARKHFKIASKLRPTDLSILYNLGMILLELDDKNGSLNCFLDIQQKNPKHKESALAIAKIMKENNLYSQALDWLVYIESIDPLDPLPNIKSAQIYIKIEKNKMAITKYQIALDQLNNLINPEKKNNNLIVNTNILIENENDINQNYNTNNNNSGNNRNRFLFKNKFFKKKTKDFEQIRLKILFTLGKLLKESYFKKKYKKELNQAVYYFSEFLLKNNNYISINKKYIYQDKNKNDDDNNNDKYDHDDKKERKKVNQTNNNLIIETNLSLGKIFLKLKDYKQAKERFDLVLKKDSQNFEAKLYLAVVKSKTNLNFAIKAIKKLSNENPKNSNCQLQLSKLLNRQGEKYISIQKFQNAMNLKPKSIMSAKNAGPILQGLDKKFLNLNQNYNTKLKINKDCDHYEDNNESTDAINLNKKKKNGGDDDGDKKTQNNNKANNVNINQIKNDHGLNIGNKNHSQNSINYNNTKFFSIEQIQILCDSISKKIILINKLDLTNRLVGSEGALLILEFLKNNWDVLFVQFANKDIIELSTLKSINNFILRNNIINNNPFLKDLYLFFHFNNNDDETGNGQGKKKIKRKKYLQNFYTDLLKIKFGKYYQSFLKIINNNNINKIQTKRFILAILTGVFVFDNKLKIFNNQLPQKRNLNYFKNYPFFNPKKISNLKNIVFLTIKINNKKKNKIKNNQNGNEDVDKDEDKDEDEDEDEDEVQVEDEVEVEGNNKENHIKLPLAIALVRSKLIRNWVLQFKNIKKNLIFIDYSKRSLDSLQIIVNYWVTGKIILSPNLNFKKIMNELNGVIEYYQMNPKSSFLQKLEESVKQK